MTYAFNCRTRVDKDVWWLRRAGHIKISRTEIKIDTSALMPFLGVVQLVLFSFMMGLMFLQVGTSSAPEWKQALGFLGIGGFSGAVMLVLIKLYIVPWRTLRECGAIKAERQRRAAARARSKG